MLFFLALFALFLYFKVVRVHKKEELPSKYILFLNIFVGINAILILAYGFMNYSWWVPIVASFVFFIIAALLVTAIQLGIFVDGKPQFGISKLYKFLPFIAISIAGLSAIIWQ